MKATSLVVTLAATLAIHGCGDDGSGNAGSGAAAGSGGTGGAAGAGGVGMVGAGGRGGIGGSAPRACPSSPACVFCAADAFNSSLVSEVVPDGILVPVSYSATSDGVVDNGTLAVSLEGSTVLDLSFAFGLGITSLDINILEGSAARIAAESGASGESTFAIPETSVTLTPEAPELALQIGPDTTEFEDVFVAEDVVVVLTGFAANVEIDAGVVKLPLALDAGGPESNCTIRGEGVRVDILP